MTICSRDQYLILDGVSQFVEKKCAHLLKVSIADACPTLNTLANRYGQRELRSTLEFDQADLK